MMLSIICLICIIKTWVTGMSNPAVSFLVAQGEIAHEVFNRGNGNDHWIFRIAREKYAVSASRLVKEKNNNKHDGGNIVMCSSGDPPRILEWCRMIKPTTYVVGIQHELYSCSFQHKLSSSSTQMDSKRNRQPVVNQIFMVKVAKKLQTHYTRQRHHWLHTNRNCKDIILLNASRISLIQFIFHVFTIVSLCVSFNLRHFIVFVYSTASYSK